MFIHPIIPTKSDLVFLSPVTGGDQSFDEEEEEEEEELRMAMKRAAPAGGKPSVSFTKCLNLHISFTSGF